MRKVLTVALTAGVLLAGCGAGEELDPLENATPEQDLYIALIQASFEDQSPVRQDVFCNRWKDDPAEIQMMFHSEATDLNLYEEYHLSPEDAEEAVELYFEWECVTRWER